MPIAALVDPRVRGAYFAETVEVAVAELAAWRPSLVPELLEVGDLQFLVVDVAPADQVALARRSFVQGLFALDGSSMRPLAVDVGFGLPEALVTADRYRGKTHERVTQLAVQLAIDACRVEGGPRRLLDPMAGRGTTLWWAARHGLDSVGVEREADALDALHRHTKRQTKLLRLSHRHHKGFVGKKNRDGVGRFVSYQLGEVSVRLVAGDTREVPKLLQGQRFDLVVCDLPYGIQFRGGPQRLVDLVRAAVPGWVASLRAGGAMALVFNTYQPTREQLCSALAQEGCEVLPFTAPHRMSESIVRDVVVARRC